MRKDLWLEPQYINKLGPFRPRLESGDLAIVFDRAGQEVFFIGKSLIESADELEDQRNIQVITLGPISNFSEPRQLSVLAGSLGKVYQFLTPERHFNRPILTLSRDDFETITMNEVDIYRSVYRYLFSALPLELQADFIRRNINLLPLSTEGWVMRYEALCKILLGYYTAQVIDPMKLINSVVKQFNALGEVSGLGPLWEFDLADGNGENPIAFGKGAIYLSRIYESNPIFAVGEDRLRLIDEAISQLLTPEDPTHRTQPMRERRWTDPVF